MILNDEAIREMINGGSIGVTPDITDEQIQPASLDVRLGHEVYNPHSDISREVDEIVLPPKTFKLGTTLEQIRLPPAVAAQLTGRSTIGRKGVVVHATAGWIDPGFRGQITLEMFNMSTSTVTIDVEDRVAQLVFFWLTRPAKNPYDGQYQDQKGVQQ